MTNEVRNPKVDLSESSVHSDDTSAPARGRSEEFATDSALDRLELITGGAEEPEIAEEERLARFTESDPKQDDQGAISVEPGRDDTSRTLRRHHPSTVADSDAV